MLPSASAMACTAFWTDTTASLGWSETYYLDTTDHDVGLVALASLMALRKAFTCDVYRCSGLRVALTGAPGDSRIDVVSIPGDVDSTLRPPSDPWTALNLRVEAGTLHRGRHFLHGIPRDLFQQNRSYDPTNPSNLEVGLFWNELATVGPVRFWALKTKGASPPPFSFVQIDRCVPLKQTVRRVGRPFTLLRGRF